MFEEENNVQPTESETVVEQALEQLPEPEAAQAPAPEQESAQAKNFRTLREKAERVERERDSAMARIQQLEASRNAAQEDDEEPDDIGIGADDLVEGKHISKLNKQIKELKKNLDNYTQQTRQVTAQTQLKMQYPDIDKVVNTDNIKQLNELYPEIAYSLSTNKDDYTKAAAAYTMIKKLGIYVEDTFAQDREIAQRNAAKPKPLASVSPQQGDSPLSRANAFANGLTDELKEQLRKEMMEARRNL